MYVNWDEEWEDIKNLWRFFNNSLIQTTKTQPSCQDIRELEMQSVGGDDSKEAGRSDDTQAPCSTKNCALWEPANYLIFGSEKEWVLNVRP